MQMLEKLDDNELLRRLIGGDEAAFVTLYRRRQQAIYRFAWRMCGSEAIAEDVTQEVFMVLLREAARFDPSRCALTTWLFGIARNQTLRRLERETRHVALADYTEIDEAASAASRLANDHLDQFAVLTRKEEIETVRQAVLALPHPYREVLVLCDLNELSYADAALALDCAIGTVRSRLHRARALLSDSLHKRERSTQTVRRSLGFAV